MAKYISKSLIENSIIATRNLMKDDFIGYGIMDGLVF